MNRIKRNGYQKILSLTLSASLLLGLTGCGAQKAEETAATASEEEALLTEALSSQGAPSHSAETGKEETVYVLADASGGVEKIIVSDWLKIRTVTASCRMHRICRISRMSRATKHLSQMGKRAYLAGGRSRYLLSGKYGKTVACCGEAYL